MDDTKISHKDQAVVDQVVGMLQDRFGDLNVVNGNEHVFLGMNIEIKNKKVHIMMIDYIEEAIEAYQEPIVRKSKTPAKGLLFEVDTKLPRLDVSK